MRSALGMLVIAHRLLRVAANRVCLWQAEKKAKQREKDKERKRAAAEKKAKAVEGARAAAEAEVATAAAEAAALAARYKTCLTILLYVLLALHMC